MATFLKLALIILLPISLAGCISTYGDLPPKESSEFVVSQGQKGLTLYYQVEPLKYLEEALQRGGQFQHMPTNESYEGLEVSLKQSPILGSAIPVDHPPGKGLFVEVEVHLKPLNGGDRSLIKLSFLSLGIFPAVTNSSGHIVLFRLFCNGAMMKTFRYEVIRQEIGWIGLLPFMWMNLLTTGEGEALGGTATQFLRDALEEGFFREGPPCP